MHEYAHTSVHMHKVFCPHQQLKLYLLPAACHPLPIPGFFLNLPSPSALFPFMTLSSFLPPHSGDSHHQPPDGQNALSASLR